MIGEPIQCFERRMNPFCAWQGSREIHQRQRLVASYGFDNEAQT